MKTPLINSLFSSTTALSMLLAYSVVACGDRVEIPTPEENIGAVSSAMTVLPDEAPEQEEDDPNYDLVEVPIGFISQDSVADPRMYSYPEAAGMSYVRTTYPAETYVSTSYTGTRQYSCTTSFNGATYSYWCANATAWCPPHSANTGSLQYCKCDPGYAADAGVCVSRAIFNPPANERLPADDKGTWSGARGNSEFTPSNPLADYDLYPGQTIKFIDGRADLSRYAKAICPGMATVVSPRGLNGKDGDYAKGYTALLAEAKRVGCMPANATNADIEREMERQNLTLHHYDCALQVVPYLTHRRLAHRGAASDMRNNLLRCLQ